MSWLKTTKMSKEMKATDQMCEGHLLQAIGIPYAFLCECVSCRVGCIEVHISHMPPWRKWAFIHKTREPASHAAFLCE